MASMVRMQVQLDPATREALRRRAFEEGKSASAVAREILTRALRPTKGSKPRYDFSGIIGIIKDDPESVAENHDDYLFDDDEP
jgi:hypothetical protein